MAVVDLWLQGAAGQTVAPRTSWKCILWSYQETLHFSISSILALLRSQVRPVLAIVLYSEQQLVNMFYCNINGVLAEWIYPSPHVCSAKATICTCVKGVKTVYIVHCTALHCSALHCTPMHCTTLHCTPLHCTTLHCTALQVLLDGPPPVAYWSSSFWWSGNYN